MQTTPLYQQDCHDEARWTQPSQDSQGFAVDAVPTESPQQADFRLACKLRTLYVAEQGAVIGLEHGRIEVRQGKSVLAALPQQQVDSIMTFGAVHLNRSVLLRALSGQLPVMLMSQGAFFQGLLGAADAPSAELLTAWLLSRQQPLNVAQELVSAKIHNQLTVLRRNLRYQKTVAEELQAVIAQISPLLVALKRCHTLDELRGIEGLAARYYFSGLKQIIAPEWQFSGRNRQPALDPVNAMMSLGYSILTHNAVAFIRHRNLPVNLGFLHNADQRYPALALDTIEPFRAAIVDSTILKMIKQRKIMPAHFSHDANGCKLLPPARQLFIAELEFQLQKEVQYRDKDLATDYRRIMDAQLLLLKQSVLNHSNDFAAYRIR